jgi:hypothetical protein
MFVSKARCIILKTFRGFRFRGSRFKGSGFVVTGKENYRIKRAVKHFEALGIVTKVCSELSRKVNHLAPENMHNAFKNKAEEIIQ